MQIPQSDILSTKAMNRVFADTVATYKFYWFLSILDMHFHGANSMKTLDVAVRMVAYAQAEVLMNVANPLFPKGTAYFAIRRDLTEEGSWLHIIHKQYTYQCYVKLPYKSFVANKSYELYQYSHFNKQPCVEGEKCSFCCLSRRVKSSARRPSAWSSTTVIPSRLVMRSSSPRGTLLPTFICLTTSTRP